MGDTKALSKCLYQSQEVVSRFLTCSKAQSPGRIPLPSMLPLRVLRLEALTVGSSDSSVSVSKAFFPTLVCSVEECSQNTALSSDRQLWSPASLQILSVHPLHTLKRYQIISERYWAHPRRGIVCCGIRPLTSTLSILVSHLLELKEHCKKNASFETGLQEGDTGHQGFPFVCMGKNNHQHEELSLYHSCMRKGEGCSTARGCCNPVDLYYLIN